MDLEFSVTSARVYVVIKAEREKNGRIKYTRLDTGKILFPETIEFLQEPSWLIAHDGKSKTNVVISPKNPYVQRHANAIVLGEKLTHQNYYSYSFCKARL